MRSRLSRTYKRNVNIITILKITLVAVFVTIYNLPVRVANAQTPAAISPITTTLAPLTNEVVSINQPTVTITVTQSVYQKQLALQAEQARKAAFAAAASVATINAQVSDDQKLALVQKAAAMYGIDWRILNAVWQIESGRAWQTAVTSSAGAVGPCQFMPGTWVGYAYDGDGDGVKSITKAQDCLYGAAKLLATNGAASGDVQTALLHYNHSMAYVQEVLKLAGLS